MTRARAFWLKGEGRGVLRKENLPEPRPEWCTVRTMFSAVSPARNGSSRWAGCRRRSARRCAALTWAGVSLSPSNTGTRSSEKSSAGPKDLLRPQGPRPPSASGHLRRPARGRPAHPGRTAAGPGHPGQQPRDGRYGRVGFRSDPRRARARRRLRRSSARSSPGSSARARRSISRSPRQRAGRRRLAESMGFRTTPAPKPGAFDVAFDTSGTPAGLAGGHRQRRRRRPGRRRELVRRRGRRASTSAGASTAGERGSSAPRSPASPAPFGPAGTPPGGRSSSSACSSVRNSTSTSGRRSPSQGCPRLFRRARPALARGPEPFDHLLRRSHVQCHASAITPSSPIR